MSTKLQIFNDELLQVSSQAMKVNDGYGYFGLKRCKDFDSFFVTRCYHATELRIVTEALWKNF